MSEPRSEQEQSPEENASHDAEIECALCRLGRSPGGIVALLVGAVVLASWMVIEQTHKDRPAAGLQDDNGAQTQAPAADPSAPSSVRTEEPPTIPLTEAERRFGRQRREMVDRQLRRRDITDARILDAMERVPRHRLIPTEYDYLAYGDHPLPIGYDQTISQPYIVALMTQLAEVGPDDRALDIGTGSGYQAAVLAELCKEVYSIEIVEPLADKARARLKGLGYKNIEVRHGDGYIGWKEHSPFDVIIVAAAPERVPEPLVEQLAPGGRLVIPVGDPFQHIEVIEKRHDGSIHRRTDIAVRFVPMTGRAQRND